MLYELGQIDLFIHDSLHSERNVLFELNRTWPMLGPKGALVVDDVDANWGFRLFSQPSQVSLICEAEPLRPDLARLPIDLLDVGFWRSGLADAQT